MKKYVSVIFSPKTKPSISVCKNHQGDSPGLGWNVKKKLTGLGANIGSEVSGVSSRSTPSRILTSIYWGGGNGAGFKPFAFHSWNLRLLHLLLVMTCSAGLVPLLPICQRNQDKRSNDLYKVQMQSPEIWNFQMIWKYGNFP